MSAILPELGLVGFLVILNAAFAGTELALVSLREGQLQRLERRSSTGKVLVRLAREPNRFLATIQIGITLAGFLASAAAAVSLAEPLREPLSFLGAAAEPVAVVAVTLALSYVTLVFGELAPKRVAMQRAEQWALVAARPLAAISVVARPAVWLLSRSTDIAVRLLGADPSRDRQDVTEQEIRDLVASQKSLTRKHRLIIDGAFEIAERTLHEVVRPRPDVFVLDSQLPCSEGLGLLAKSGHSRAPVAKGGMLDEAIAQVHLRDLIDCGGRTIGQVATDLMSMPESQRVLDALLQMQRARVNLALVVDGYGTTAGIVTIEDLLEEVVGEIYDETDKDIPTVEVGPNDTLILPGRFPVHDLHDVGIDGIPEGDYATVAGLLMDRIGRVPKAPGDVIEVGGWKFQVIALRRRAITKVSVAPATTSGHHSRDTAGQSRV